MAVGVKPVVRMPTISAVPDVTCACTPPSREAVATGSGAGSSKC